MAVQTQFQYRDGELFCEAVPARQVAREHGTPCYVYSATELQQRFWQISGAFRQWCPIICFSIKSCANLSILRLLAEQGSGFDVVSGGELYRALQAGADPGRIVYAGVGKTAQEIEFALREGILMFNVESRPELEHIDLVARRMGTQARCAVRVNPDVDPDTHEKTTTGKAGTKFGIGIGAAEALIREAADWQGVHVRGIHLHLGSPIYKTEPYQRALEKVTGLYRRLRADGLELNWINLGGGYCISYTGEDVVGPHDYAEAVNPCLEKLDCRVIIEPGRYIAGNSAVLLTRIIYRKVGELGKRFLICDAAMNDLIRPTLYDAYQRIWPVHSPGGMPGVMKPGDTGYEGFETEVVDVVGPVCETGDYLGLDRPLPPAQREDLLAVFGAGAYGFTMSSNYNGRPRAPEVLVEGDRARLVRRRETRQDLVEPERDCL